MPGRGGAVAPFRIDESWRAGCLPPQPALRAIGLAPGTRPAQSHGHMDLHSGAPFWLVRNGLDAEREALHRDERCDVATHGAGVTGALVTDALITAGMDVVMVEQRMP